MFDFGKDDEEDEVEEIREKIEELKKNEKKIELLEEMESVEDLFEHERKLNEERLPAPDFALIDLPDPFDAGGGRNEVLVAQFETDSGKVYTDIFNLGTMSHTQYQDVRDYHEWDTFEIMTYEDMIQSLLEDNDIRKGEE